MQQNFIEDNIQIISKQTMDEFLKYKGIASDLIGLYMFYYYTAKWQDTNQPKATTKYVAKGLGWSEARVRRIKKKLIEIGLIEDVQVKDEKGRTAGWYIRLNYIWKKETINKIHTMENPQGGNNHRVENFRANALNVNNKNNIYSPSNTSNNDNHLQDIDNSLNDSGVKNGEYIVGQNPTNKRKRKNNDIEKKGYIVLKYLNIKAERNFQKIHRYIKARLKEYHLNDLLDVIDYKCYEWKDNPEMKKYLRPETLFAPTHFDTYLDEAKRELFEMEYSKWLDEWMEEQRRKGAQQITYLPKRDYFKEEFYDKIRQKQISNILTSGGR